MKKAILISLLVMIFSGSLSAQACGYIFARFQILDSKGNAIEVAKLDLLGRDERESILYQKDELVFSPTERSYKLHHGMCGSHYGILMVVTHPEYELFEKEIDLPLNTRDQEHIFIVRLNKKKL